MAMPATARPAISDSRLSARRWLTAAVAVVAGAAGGAATALRAEGDAVGRASERVGDRVRQLLDGGPVGVFVITACIRGTALALCDHAHDEALEKSVSGIRKPTADAGDRLWLPLGVRGELFRQLP